MKALSSKSGQAAFHSYTSDSSHNNETVKKVNSKEKKMSKQFTNILNGIPPEEIQNSKRSMRTRDKTINYAIDNEEEDKEVKKTFYPPKIKENESFESDFDFSKKKRKKVKISKISKVPKIPKKLKKNKKNSSLKKQMLKKNKEENETLEEKRKNQIECLLNWKNNIPNPPKNNLEYGYYTVSSINSIENIKSFLSLSSNQLHSILISPPWNNENYDFNEFMKLNIPIDAMENGIILIWTKKDFLSEMVDYIEGLNSQIKYVENLVWVKLSKNCSDTKSTDSNPFELTDIFYNGQSKYFTSSHLTLLMFKKEKHLSTKIELRHQRTSDAVFDIFDEDQNPNYYPNNYIYNMIEILLPKANISEPPKGTLKMIELYANKDTKRKGWIFLCEE